MTKVLFDSTKVNHPTRLFGLGLAANSNRTRRPRFEPSPADAAWWSQNSPANTTGYEVLGPADSLIDVAAADALAQSRVDAGYVAC